MLPISWLIAELSSVGRSQSNTVLLCGAMDLMNNIYHRSAHKYIQQCKSKFTIAMSYSNSIHFPMINFLHPCPALYCRMINETFHTLFYGTFHIFNIPLSTDFTESLRLTEVRIPNHVIRNNSVKLECHFDMNGEQLYSVKWYKDGYEFYRYVPRWVYTSATQNHMICGESLDGKLSPFVCFGELLIFNLLMFWFNTKYEFSCYHPQRSSTSSGLWPEWNQCRREYQAA